MTIKCWNKDGGTHIIDVRREFRKAQASGTYDSYEKYESDVWADVRNRINNESYTKIEVKTIIGESLEYVAAHQDEFDKDKFYLDACGGGWVRRVYYNPDSNAGGQLVDDLLSVYDISAVAKECSSEDDFWNYTCEHARQTLVDVDTIDFEGSARGFVEDSCDLVGQSVATMESLKKWAEDYLIKNGGKS